MRNISTYFESRHQMEVSGELQAPAALSLRNSPGDHLRGGWVGPEVRLDNFGEESEEGEEPYLFSLYMPSFFFMAQHP
jgi:hypothetical protein